MKSGAKPSGKKVFSYTSMFMGFFIIVLNLLLLERSAKSLDILGYMLIILGLIILLVDELEPTQRIIS